MPNINQQTLKKSFWQTASFSGRASSFFSFPITPFCKFEEHLHYVTRYFGFDVRAISEDEKVLKQFVLSEVLFEFLILLEKEIDKKRQNAGKRDWPLLRVKSQLKRFFLVPSLVYSRQSRTWTVRIYRGNSKTYIHYDLVEGRSLKECYQAGIQEVFDVMEDHQLFPGS